MSANKHWLVPEWPAPENIHAATTLRTGGVSAGVYASLNPALHVGDRNEWVIENRQIIKTQLNLPSEPVWLNQIHSNLVIDAARSETLPEADASYNMEPGIVCAVMTADCLPLLVCDTEGTCVAAIHAGWRGLLAGVIANTVDSLQKKNLLVWLGPAIGPECFEVGTEVRDLFVNKSASFINAFRKQDQGKWLADIYQLARTELATAGIDRIYGGDFCTVTEQARFYSYRRDKETGRMASLIWRE
jgi:YfiH family protein